MAKAQGGNAITVGMIVFVALWLTSTVFLVILYTGQQELIDLNTRLEAANRKLISPQEERTLEITRTARPEGPTVVSLLERARQQTAEIATGVAEDDVATVRSKRDQLLQSLRIDGIVDDPNAYQGISFHEALANLYEAYRGMHEKWRTAEDSLLQLQGDLVAMRETTEALKTEYAQRTQASQDQVAEIEANHTRYRKERDSAVTAIEKEFEDARSLNTQLLTAERRQRQACEQRLVEAQARFSAMREKLGGLMVGPAHLATARQPDGRILTAVPGDAVVYINLGRQDGLTLGLQFAVYSPQTGIPPDGRGKGQVEVVSISDSSAECRIVHVARNQVILQDDLIANPVYDPDRPLSFVVTGLFDLDRDGRPDPDGGEAIRALIANWGGTVSEELNAQTDFLVIGVAPRKPQPAADAPPEQQAQNRSLQRSWDAYESARNTAEALSVPVLTQEVFMSFLGYGSSRVSRR